MAIRDRIKRSWNAFRNEQEQERVQESPATYGPTSWGRPDRPRLYITNERSIIDSIYTRISIDVAEVALRHIVLDDDNRYKEDVKSKLAQCLSLEPNLDQGPTQFRQDIVMTMLDKGVAAIVPVDTDRDPTEDDDFDIHSMRVGDVRDWYPRHVRVNLYNEVKGQRQEIVLDKRTVGIVVNPFYTVMNEPNSTLKRLSKKLSLLDNVDETSAGRLDMIIQLPYVVKTEARKEQAERRRKEVEFQLKESQYGIAYTDGSEKITQLNRPVENQLLKQVEYLTNLLFGQLGLDESIMNGTADEATMLNYKNRTVKPILKAIMESMQRSFLREKRTAKGERLLYFRNPFELITAEKLADIADRFTRNEILTANEIRGYMGIPPSNEPKADRLENSNMPKPEETGGPDDLSGLPPSLTSEPSS